MPTHYCTNHKDRETLRICGRCERPFCPDCLVSTPVGGRCRECARGPKLPGQRLDAWRWPAVAGIALAGGLIGGLVSGMIPFLGIIVAAFIGQFLGNTILAAARRRTGVVLANTSAALVALGCLAPVLAVAFFAVAAGHLPAFGIGIVWRLIEAGVMAVSAQSRLR